MTETVNSYIYFSIDFTSVWIISTQTLVLYIVIFFFCQKTITLNQLVHTRRTQHIFKLENRRRKLS